MPTARSEKPTKIKPIESTQAQKKAIADALNQARDMKSQGHYLNDWGDADGIPDSLKNFAKEVQLQDRMGQYNSYIQGANSAISTSKQTLSSLARGQ